MAFKLKIVDWMARAPGLSEAADWRDWARDGREIDPAAPLAKSVSLPMMTARRLTSGSRLAVDCGMALLARHDIGAVLYTSRHGELERNFRILQALAMGQDLSPTDFAMSVHNASVGSLTIASKQPLVSSSLSAGVDTFQQGMYEVLCLLQAGYRRVLMVDFDGAIPEFYHPLFPETFPFWAYAVALVIEAGDDLNCESGRCEKPGEALSLPQGLMFLKGWLGEAPTFDVPGDGLNWRWQRG